MGYAFKIKCVPHHNDNTSILLLIKSIIDQHLSFITYSRSRRLGFRDGSLERKPKMNKETKKITVV